MTINHCVISRNQELDNNDAMFGYGSDLRHLAHPLTVIQCSLLMVLAYF